MLRVSQVGWPPSRADAAASLASRQHRWRAVSKEDVAEAMNKHALLMLACCLVPLAILGVVLTSGVNLGGYLPFAIMLLCPLMHILMMRGMGHDHAGHREETPGAGNSTPACHGDARPVIAEPTGSRR